MLCSVILPEAAIHLLAYIFAELLAGAACAVLDGVTQQLTLGFFELLHWLELWLLGTCSTSCTRPPPIMMRGIVAKCTIVP